MDGHAQAQRLCWEAVFMARQAGAQAPDLLASTGAICQHVAINQQKRHIAEAEKRLGLLCNLVEQRFEIEDAGDLFGNLAHRREHVGARIRVYEAGNMSATSSLCNAWGLSCARHAGSDVAVMVSCLRIIIAAARV